MTTGRGRMPDPGPRRPGGKRPGQRDRGRSGGTGRNALDLGAVQRTGLILDALAARRGPAGPADAVARAGADPAVVLLAALAADVEQDLPAGAWLASPWLAPQRAGGRPAGPAGDGRRRMRAAIMLSAAAVMLTTAVMMSPAGPSLPGPFRWPGSILGQAGSGHAPARPKGPAAPRGRAGQGPLAALPGIWLPFSPAGAADGTATAKRR